MEANADKVWRYSYNQLPKPNYAYVLKDKAWLKTTALQENFET